MIPQSTPKCKISTDPDDSGHSPRTFDAPAGGLEKREGELQKLWGSVSDKDKVTTGNAVGFPLYPDHGQQSAVFAPTEFYGCTLVVIVNGHGVIIGHFAQESAGAGGCTTMTDKKMVETKLIPVLQTAEANVDVDGHADTRAWIVLSDDIGVDAPGYKAIMENLKDQMEVQPKNINKIAYRRGGGGGNSDKLAVQWKVKADGSGATLTVYIRSDKHKFQQDYDCEGNPIPKGSENTACANKASIPDESRKSLAGTNSTISNVSTSQRLYLSIHSPFTNVNPPGNDIERHGESICVSNLADNIAHKSFYIVLCQATISNEMD